MHAVIQTGGKQYRVAQGDAVDIETLPGDVGTEVEFDRVLAVTDGASVKTGADASGARVKATITEQNRADKVLVFKFKRKKQYRRTIGHRQNFTRVVVNEILA